MTITRRQAAHLRRVQARLGEGPIWDARRGALWFVDIISETVHRLNPASGEHSRWRTPSKVGWVIPASGGDLLCGLSDGLYRFSSRNGRFTLLHAVEIDLPGNRLNDAAIGPSGEVWFGTMNDADQRPSGRFYRFDGRVVKDCGIAAMRVTNGPAISPDGHTLYTVDTFAGLITAHAIHEQGTLAEARPFVRIVPEEGYPDGITCDAEGGVWVALWAGYVARRYNVLGVITDEVRFPVSHVTKIALGGADGRTAYATTARAGLDDDALAEQPLAGDIFTFPVQTPGVTAPEFMFE